MPIPNRDNVKKDLVKLLKAEGELIPSKAYGILSKKWALTEQEQYEVRSGRPKYQHEIRWARQELKIEGIISSPEISGRGTWKLAYKSIGDIEVPGDENLSGKYYEGALRTIKVNAYERNPKARKKCLKHYGYNCSVCKVNLEKEYGEAGKELIHVHHIVEISTTGREYEVDPIKDLIPICPNCHLIVHRKKPAYTIDEVKRMLKND